MKMFSPRNQDYGDLDNLDNIIDKIMRVGPTIRFQAQERLEIDYDLDNFEKKNPSLFAKFYSPNFENPHLFKKMQTLTNRIEESPSPFRTPSFTPTFNHMRSSTPLKIHESCSKSLKPPSRPLSTVSTKVESTNSQINYEKITPEKDDDVRFVSEFHPKKISTQSQKRFLPYKPVRSTGAELVKEETEPQTVAEIIRSQAISQMTQVSTASNVKNEPYNDVQFSFEFHPQRMSTQLPQPGQKMASSSFRPPHKTSCKSESQTVQERIMNTQPTVADLIRTEAIAESQLRTQIISTQTSDVQFSFKFDPQKSSTQIPSKATIQSSFRPPNFTLETKTQRIIETTRSQIITQTEQNSRDDYQNEIKIHNSNDTFNQTDYSTSEEDDNDDDEKFNLSAIPELEDCGTFSPLLSPASSQKSQHSQQQSATNTQDEAVDLNSLIHDQSRNLFSTQRTNIISSQ